MNMSAFMKNGRTNLNSKLTTEFDFILQCQIARVSQNHKLSESSS